MFDVRGAGDAPLRRLVAAAAGRARAADGRRGRGLNRKTSLVSGSWAVPSMSWLHGGARELVPTRTGHHPVQRSRCRKHLLGHPRALLVAILGKGDPAPHRLQVRPQLAGRGAISGNRQSASSPAPCQAPRVPLNDDCRVPEGAAHEEHAGPMRGHGRPEALAGPHPEQLQHQVLRRVLSARRGDPEQCLPQRRHPAEGEERGLCLEAAPCPVDLQPSLLSACHLAGSHLCVVLSSLLRTKQPLHFPCQSKCHPFYLVSQLQRLCVHGGGQQDLRTAHHVQGLFLMGVESRQRTDGVEQPSARSARPIHALEDGGRLLVGRSEECQRLAAVDRKDTMLAEEVVEAPAVWEDLTLVPQRLEHS
mmetsp:Transcript_34986/g.93044  ORF Transcript_34986/g.93044 Transcript_34986/m.93044 type:complete len:362 (-) Transcript_34986:1341-2426(-)